MENVVYEVSPTDFNYTVESLLDDKWVEQKKYDLFAVAVEEADKLALSGVHARVLEKLNSGMTSKRVHKISDLPDNKDVLLVSDNEPLLPAMGTIVGGVRCWSMPGTEVFFLDEGLCTGEGLVDDTSDEMSYLPATIIYEWDTQED